MQFLPNNPPGNAAKIGDNKPEFWRLSKVWVAKWENEKIPYFEVFIWTKQTCSALIRTLLCHAALIEALLDEGHRYILTSHFQNNPLERKFGKCRQMSGGRFLVGLRDVTHSKKNMKLKSLLKGDINTLTENFFSQKWWRREITKCSIWYNFKKSNKGNHCLVWWY